ncbi:MAG: hypothetical protein WKF84_13600 [Pyrinomonadaceae bacterium]
MDEELFHAGCEYFQKHEDKGVFTDGLHIVCGDEGDLEISVVYAFDRHFKQAGFQRQPEGS